jgi:hypothetical protein
VGFDTLETASASAFVYGTLESPYQFGPSEPMRHDVQSWIDNPSSNFGWLLRSTSEASPKTARRFGSREDFLNTPLLRIEYEPRLAFQRVFRTNEVTGLEINLLPASEIRLLSSTRIDDPAGWQVLTNLTGSSTASSLLIWDSSPASERYYRLELVTTSSR